MLDVRKLRLLRELQIRGTVTGVAEALSYSPSSVSQQLSALEREAGVPLLEKAGRRVQLTAQGHILVQHTAEILDRLERAEAALSASLTSRHRSGPHRGVPVGGARHRPACPHDPGHRLPRAPGGGHRTRTRAGSLRGLRPRFRPRHRRAVPGQHPRPARRPRPDRPHLRHHPARHVGRPGCAHPHVLPRGRRPPALGDGARGHGGAHLGHAALPLRRLRTGRPLRDRRPDRPHPPGPLRQRRRSAPRPRLGRRGAARPSAGSAGCAHGAPSSPRHAAPRPGSPVCSPAATLSRGPCPERFP